MKIEITKIEIKCHYNMFTYAIPQFLVSIVNYLLPTRIILMTHCIILYKSNISFSFLHDQQEPLKVNNKVILIRSDEFQKNALL